MYPDSKEIILVYLPMIEPGYIMSERTDYGMKRVPLLGLQYLVAVLNKAGNNTRLLDGSFEDITIDGLQRMHQTQPTLFMGFYAHHYIREGLAFVLASLRRRCPDLITVIGGPGYFDDLFYLEAGADYVCRGEGERTVVQLAEYLRGERPRSRLRGISGRFDGEIRRLPPQEPILDLDELPFPDRSAYPIDLYHDYHVVGFRKPYSTMITSRGCPFHCSFCTTHDIWGGLRRRSPANVLAEIDYLVEHFGIRYIGFKDDLFGSHRVWVERFIAGLRDRNYDLRFNCMLSPLSFNWDPEGTLRRLRDVGLDMIIPGLQSANPRILRRIGRRPSDPSRLALLVKAAKRLGITTVVEFILGLPDENVETVRENFEYALKIRPHYALFFSLAVLEGSAIEKQYEDSPVCDLSEIEVKRLVDVCSKRYFGHPAVFVQFLRHVLVKNPRWFVQVIPHALYLLKAVGFVRKRLD